MVQINQPIILCLETSSSYCSAAIRTEITFLSKSNGRQSHAENFMLVINECLKLSGLKLHQISAIAISNGPGSYTGLRIGASSAKGLCYGLKIPLISIDTLKIIAYGALHLYPHVNSIWPMIDARRMEVYHCLYNSSLEIIREMNNSIITEPGFISTEISNETIICGDGAEKAAEYLGLKFCDFQLDASLMCNLAEQSFLEGKFVDLSSYEPLYHKGANITLSKK